MCDLEDQRHFIQLRRKGEAGQVPDLKVDPFKERTRILGPFKERARIFDPFKERAKILDHFKERRAGRI